MNAPNVWLKSAIEAAAAGVTVWPVEMTGSGDPPYAIYMREGTTRESVLDDVLDDTPVANAIPPVARFTVIVFADSYVQAWNIATTIRGAVHNFSGSGDGWIIHSSYVTDERDGDAVFLDGREQPTYTVEMVVDVQYQE